MIDRNNFIMENKVPNRNLIISLLVMVLALMSPNIGAEEVAADIPVYEIVRPFHAIVVPSVHIGLERAFEIPERLLSAMRRDGYLYLEYDVLSYSSADSNPLMPPKYVVTDEQKTERFAAMAKSIKKLPGSRGLSDSDLTEIMGLHPFIILTRISSICDSQVKFDAKEPLDATLRNAAIGRGMNVRSLETIDDSMISVLKISEEEWEKFIINLIDRIDDKKCDEIGSSLVKDVQYAMVTGDMERAYSALVNYNKRIFGDKILSNAYTSEERSFNQLRKISEISLDMPKGSPIFVIGAAHLGGPHGLLKAACDAGDTVLSVVHEVESEFCDGHFHEK